MTSHGPGPSEYVSGIALDVLDELRIKLLECRLVLQALPDEADLNFDDLDEKIRAALEVARFTFEAASLVHQRAQLAERWGIGWSRPKAIFARHSAAVRNGAPRVTPKPSSSDQLEWSLWQLSTPSRANDAPASRPRCSGTVRATRLPCTSSAIYLGSGTFGAHCYSHASPQERIRYRTHNDAVVAAEIDTHEALIGRRISAGRNTTADWLQRRKDRQQRSGENVPSGQSTV